MICDISKQRKQFEELMFKCIGNSIIPQSKQLINSIKGKIIKPEYLKKYIETLKHNDIPYKIRNATEHIYFGDISNLHPNAKLYFDLHRNNDGPNFYIQDGQIGICYLEQYEIHDKKRAKIFEKNLQDFFWENRDGEVSGWHSMSVGHHNDFLFDEVKYSDRYCYFITDQKYEEDVKNISSYMLGYDVNFNHLDIVNQEYEIDGLIWFKFKDEQYPQKGSSLSYKLLCLLMDSNINHCIFSDYDGKITIDTRIKVKGDNRISITKFRKDLNKVLKSSWEANFARILDYLNIEWEYEKTSFMLEDRYYFPDFFLPNNTVVEIKGLWDSDSIKKVNSFMDLYSGYKLYIIDKDMMYSLEQLYKNDIEHWEERSISSLKAEVLPVVGITLLQRKKVVSALQIGEQVFLKRDSENPYDKNAIQVLNSDGQQIGFISKQWASIYASKLDVGMVFKAKIKSKQEKVIKVEVERTNISEHIVYDFLFPPLLRK